MLIFPDRAWSGTRKGHSKKGGRKRPAGKWSVETLLETETDYMEERFGNPVHDKYNT